MSRLDRASACSDAGTKDRWLGTLLREFPWLHLGIGLFGNAMFVVGSVLFFYQSVMTLAIWLFVIGSLGMFLGSAGELLVRIEKRRLHQD